MFLTKNRLKKIKRVEDDDMLHYLKYSHLEPIKEDNTLRIDKATQYPDIRNNFTQTQLIQTSDKETDTYDDLNKMDRNARYILTGYDKGFKNDKQTQVNSYLIREYEPKTPPSSSDEDKEGFVSRNVRRGFRLAEFALNTSIMGANLSMAVGDTIADMITAPHQSSEEEQQNNQEVISVHSSPAQTINSSSSSSDVEEVPPPAIQISSSSSSRNAPSSIPAPTSPQPSTPASSAKTTPRRK